MTLPLRKSSFLVAPSKVSELPADREACFDRFFPGISTSAVVRLDAESDHFIIHDRFNQTVVGGFRLTAIGSDQSEAERVFPGFPFKAPSHELGGLWLTQGLNESARGWIAVRDSFHFLRGRVDPIYFKTSFLKGNAARRFGAKYLNHSAMNPAMGYVCHLFELEMK